MGWRVVKGLDMLQVPVIQFNYLLFTATHSLRSSPSGKATALRKFPEPSVAAACFIRSYWWVPSGMFFLGLKVLLEREPLSEERVRVGCIGMPQQQIHMNELHTHTHTRLLKQRVALFVFGSCNLLARAQLTHIPHTEQHAHTSMIVCVRVHMHILIYLQQKFHCHTIIVPVTVRCLSTSSVTCWAVWLLLFFKTDSQWKCNVNVNSNYILFYILITNFG